MSGHPDAGFRLTGEDSLADLQSETMRLQELVHSKVMALVYAPKGQLTDLGLETTAEERTRLQDNTGATPEWILISRLCRDIDRLFSRREADIRAAVEKALEDERSQVGVSLIKLTKEDGTKEILLADRPIGKLVAEAVRAEREECAAIFDGKAAWWEESRLHTNERDHAEFSRQKRDEMHELAAAIRARAAVAEATLPPVGVEGHAQYWKPLADAIKQAVVAEREACAKVADEWEQKLSDMESATSRSRRIAAAIRARGQT